MFPWSYCYYCIKDRESVSAHACACDSFPAWAWLREDNSSAGINAQNTKTSVLRLSLDWTQTFSSTHEPTSPFIPSPVVSRAAWCNISKLTSEGGFLTCTWHVRGDSEKIHDRHASPALSNHLLPAPPPTSSVRLCDPGDGLRDCDEGVLPDPAVRPFD